MAAIGLRLKLTSIFWIFCFTNSYYACFSYAPGHSRTTSFFVLRWPCHVTFDPGALSLNTWGHRQGKTPPTPGVEGKEGPGSLCTCPTSCPGPTPSTCLRRQMQPCPSFRCTGRRRHPTACAVQLHTLAHARWSAATISGSTQQHGHGVARAA